MNLTKLPYAACKPTRGPKVRTVTLVPLNDPAAVGFDSGEMVDPEDVGIFRYEMKLEADLVSLCPAAAPSRC